MFRLTAYVSGRVQKVGYRARVIALAEDLSLAGFVQNLPDGRVEVVAEGRKDVLEKFAAALKIKNTFIDVRDVEAEYSEATGGYKRFHKISASGEVGDRLDEGIEILKEMSSGIKYLGSRMDLMLDKQDLMLNKQDLMLDKQDDTIGEIKGLRQDLKGHGSTI